MKTLIMTFFIFVLLLLSPEAKSITIKMHGSGGVSSTDGKNTICPNKSSDVCATVTGNLWDLLKEWWNSKVVLPTTLPDADLTFIDAQGREITYRNISINLTSGDILYSNKSTGDITISTETAVIIK